MQRLLRSTGPTSDLKSTGNENSRNFFCLKHGHEMRPVCPFLWMSDPQKSFNSAPRPCRGLRPQTPVTGSRSPWSGPLHFFYRSLCLWP